MAAKYKLKDMYPLKISRADDPSNILWENLDCTKWERFWRRSFVIILVAFLMLITFAIVFIASIFSNSG